MRKALAAITFAIALVPAVSAADPSGTCDAGFVPPATTAAGVGAKLDTSPGTATATVCSTGTAAPVAGSVRVTGSARGSALVVVDGDPGWTTLPCSDGYVGAAADEDGPRFYQNGDGGFTSRARAKSATELANDVAKSCVPPLS